MTSFAPHFVVTPSGGTRRILQILASLDPEHGGVIDGALQLARIWSANGLNVEFATLDAPKAPYLANLPFKAHALGHGGLQKPGTPVPFHKRVGISPHMVTWLRHNLPAYDAVVVHALWNFSTAAARLTLPRSGVPYVAFPHGALDPWFAQTYPIKHKVKALTWRLFEGPLLRHARAVLFTTAEEQRLADQSFTPYIVKPRVVGFGSADWHGDRQTMAAAFRGHLPALGDKPYLLFLSRIHPKKGCDLLIQAFGRMAADQDLHLVIAGPDQIGWQAELEEQARRIGIAERLHWPGMIHGDVKWGAFLGCEAFILPSHSENFGIVVAEALACGRPVLLTDKVNVWREVIKCQAGFAGEDTQSGVNALIAQFLALSADHRQQMGLNARECFERHFQFEAAAERILQALEPTTA